MGTLGRREILSRVAAGTISPAEAAAQLDGIPEPAEDSPNLRALRVIRQFGNLEIIGDPSVHDAVAEGPHHARIDGDVMVIDADRGDQPGGFFFGFVNHLADGRLVVRVNPRLELDLHLQGGSGRIRGVQGKIRADIQAASAVIDGFTQALDISVQAGSLRATGQLDAGESRVACDAGSVSLHLEHGSSVRVKARAHMGKVTLPDGQEYAGHHGTQEVTLGDGAASLLVETSMGSVRVTADR